MKLEFPLKYLRSAKVDMDETVAEARDLLAEIATCLGRADLGGLDLLDMGCGIKFSQAIHEYDLAIGSYTGVDVYAEMIAELQSAVTDDRFGYHHFPVRNELYNPEAPVMTAASDIGVGQRTFDVITLYSVFTHLNPEDYAVMLELLRRYARPDSTLFYTLFVDEFTEAGLGFTDKWADILGYEGPRTNADREVMPFRDAQPDRPMMQAVYSRDHALELLAASPWEMVELRPPDRRRQHLAICRPRS